MEEGERIVGKPEVSISSTTMKELDESNEIENLKKIEAALFLAARFLSLNDLVLLTDVNPLMLRELIDKLISKYNTEESAIEIIVKENMWKMDVAKEYVGMVNKLATGSSEFSKAEQETLAVIAYKQPVKQSVIIKIRGNKAYDHVKHFIEIGLVQAKRAGHTKELRLSDDFFDYFHLKNSKGVLDDHPDSESNEEFGDLQKKQGQEIGEIVPVEGGEDTDNDLQDKRELVSTESIEQASENVQTDEDDSNVAKDKSKIEGVKEDVGG